MYKALFRLQQAKYHGSDEKESRLVVAMPANRDDEDLGDSQVGDCEIIDQGKKLSVRDPDICSIPPEHAR